MKIEQAKNILINGKYYQNYNFVFTNEDNSYILRASTLVFLKEACKKRRIRIYNITWIQAYTCCASATKWSEHKYVSERLGHSTINMTADVYLHVTKSMEETSVNQYDEFLKSRGQIVGNRC